MKNNQLDLSVVIIEQEAGAKASRFHEIHSILSHLQISYEVLFISSSTNESIEDGLQENNFKAITLPLNEYGDKLLLGIQQASGEYIITMDYEQTIPFMFLQELWESRHVAEVIIASRYIENGQAKMPTIRRALSKTLNIIFSRGLDLPVTDMSSGFRMYKSHIIKKASAKYRGFDILQETLVKILLEGHSVHEIPLKYRSSDPAYKRMTQFGLAYLKTFFRLWKLRNSIASADYDARAYNAMMPPQRYWQRQRFKHITEMLNNKGACLDVGCGSSRIIGALPQGSIALDILFRKLRYARRFEQITVQGSIFDLPVPAESFPCVLCSQVIEHVPRANVLDELDRVLKPGGYLILGTPDYAKWQWNVIEWLYKIILPQAYADEHITHYTFQELHDAFVTKRGYKLETTRYILQGELILGLRKPGS